MVAIGTEQGAPLSDADRQDFDASACLSPHSPPHPRLL
jgi:hypothetical protein